MILPVGIGPQEGGYQIERSLRFNSADSAYLSRTPASAGNRKTWTISVWIKRTNPGTENWVYDGGSTSNSSGFQFTDTNLLRVLSTSSSGAVDDLDIRTTQVFRDPSAWYHIVLAVDTTQATSTNRVKLYVNGSQVTAFGTANYPTQNYDFGVNNNHSQKIGKWNISTGRDFSGYMADFILIDGQALTPSSFGETDTDTGVWKPKAYTGSYGTNGFYLDFADNSSTTALGYDAAGSNDWTPNNFSVTAGAGNDSLVDTPTNYGTDTGAGGEVRGNYATMNPLDQAGGLVFAEGNLKVTANTGWDGSRATFSYPSTGKWYWEATCISRSSGATVGVLSTSAVITGDLGAAATGYVYNSGDGNKYNNGSNSAYGAAWTTNDIIGIAWDADTGALSFYKNGVSQGTAYTGLTGQFSPAIGVNGSDSMLANFGQRPFAYTAPSGFKALCTQNLPEPTVKKGGSYFNAVPYTGNSSTQTISGVGFQPDFTWLKGRSYAGPHKLFDAVRGATKSLSSNLTDAEVTDSDALTAFTSDGFSLGADGDVNRSADGGTHISWNWKANGAGVSNNSGTITSTVSANTTSGFSIVTYTGNGTSGATVGHGLGAEPYMMILKARTQAESWGVYHKFGNASPQNGFFRLEGTDAFVTSSSQWNNTAPSSTVFTLGNDTRSNRNTYTYVMYAFAPVAGFSAFGSYTGNGSSDGPFAYLGFRPRWVLIKNASTTGDWFLYDTARNTYNVADSRLKPNLSDAEGTGGSYGPDILSNGFKMRSNFSELNGSGNTIIYAAFAETPFSLALAR